MISSILATATPITQRPKVYTPIPAPLTLSDSQTLVYATTGIDINIGDTGGKTELKIGSDYPQFTLLNLTSGYTIQSLDPTSPATWATIGGGGNLGQAAIRNSGANQPASITIANVKTKDNQSALAWNPSIVPSDVTLQNMIMEDHTFAAIQINAAVVGSSFGNFDAQFIRGFRMHGEGSYLGSTTFEYSGFNGIVNKKNWYIEYAGREPFQVQGAADLRMDKFTARYVGEDSGQPPNQRCCVQIINSIGYMKNSIITDAYNFATVEVNEFLFENCFFGASWSGATFFIGDMSDNDWTTNAVPGGTIIIRDCVFYNPNMVASFLFDIRENNCNVRFEGHNIFPASCTNIWDDNRSSPGANTITNVGTATFTDTPPLPEFGDSPDPEYVGYEYVVVDDYYHGRGMGFRS